jgi:N utilization substance protein A
MTKEMLNAFDVLEKEKGINRELVIDAIKEAIVAAYKKEYAQAMNVDVEYNAKKGDFQVYSKRTVVEEVFDSRLEISLEDALKLDPHFEIGDEIRFEEKTKDFTRNSASIAKQVILQKLREEERTIIYNEYLPYEGQIMTGTVKHIDERAIYVNLGRIDALLSKRDQIPQETYSLDDRIEVYVTKVELNSKGTRVYVSRTAPDFVKRLFEKEVPEVAEGLVEIKNIAREAGDRAKVIVESHDDNIDAIGTVVGQKGSRVQRVVDALHGENMDIIEWNEDPAVLIANALKPAQVVQVVLGENGAAIAVVPDDQLSLAIGKRGQNVRLAAHVTNHKIDIKSESQYDQEGLEAAFSEDIDVDTDVESAE